MAYPDRQTLGRFLVRGSIVLSLASTGPLRAASAPAADSLDVVRAKDAYRLCAMLNLPQDFKGIQSARAAVTAALDKCSKDLVIIAGTLALEGPGDRNLAQKIAAIKEKTLSDLTDLVRQNQPNYSPQK